MPEKVKKTLKSASAPNFRLLNNGSLFKIRCDFTVVMSLYIETTSFICLAFRLISEYRTKQFFLN